LLGELIKELEVAFRCASEVMEIVLAVIIGMSLIAVLGVGLLGGAAATGALGGNLGNVGA
jgi:hypothetical protein